MQSPWSARTASRVPKLGASAASSVGTTIAALASSSDARRPIRSDSGPQNHAPTASAPMTTDTVSPACDGVTPNSAPSSGRIACVEYIAANIAVAPKRNGPMPPSTSRGAVAVTTPARVGCADAGRGRHRRGLGHWARGRRGAPARRLAGRARRAPRGGAARERRWIGRRARGADRCTRSRRGPRAVRPRARGVGEGRPAVQQRRRLRLAGAARGRRPSRTGGLPSIRTSPGASCARRRPFVR